MAKKNTASNSTEREFESTQKSENSQQEAEGSTPTLVVDNKEFKVILNEEENVFTSNDEIISFLVSLWQIQTDEISMKDEIIAKLTTKLEKLDLLEEKYDVVKVELDGIFYSPIDSTRKVHHNGKAIEVKNFTPEMIKEYIKKGFLVEV